MSSRRGVVLANFGGPREAGEIREFLEELLCDRDVIRTEMPRLFEWLLFRRVAKKRARRVAEDYAQIGGASPIVEVTEELGRRLGEDVIPFHRYVPATHREFVERARSYDALTVFPLFPQFSYTTSGSIARFFAKALPRMEIEWIVSYPLHPGYLSACERLIGGALEEHGFEEEKTLLIFSPHGLPRRYVDEGDPYAAECGMSFHALSSRFKSKSLLSYQSRFGKEEWLRPYTDELCRKLEMPGIENVLFVPLSFTMDHLETLYEVEKLYVPLIQQKGLRAARCPALNLDETWIAAIPQIMESARRAPNSALIRRRHRNSST